MSVWALKVCFHWSEVYCWLVRNNPWGKGNKLYLLIISMQLHSKAQNHSLCCSDKDLALKAFPVSLSADVLSCIISNICYTAATAKNKIMALWCWHSTLNIGIKTTTKKQYNLVLLPAEMTWKWKRTTGSRIISINCLLCLLFTRFF